MERAETDATLSAERSKTDDELAKSRAAVEHDADEVVVLARSRADATLHVARELVDASSNASSAEQAMRSLGRDAEDEAVAAERATADATLLAERDERQHLLSRLLRFERDATDERLAAERVRADGAVTSRDEFLGIVSHDLRGLLNALILNAGSLEARASGRGPEHANYARMAERIKHTACRMDRLIGDLLDVVSLEAGMLAVSPQLRDPSALVREAAEVFSPLFAAAGIEFLTKVTPQAQFAMFDHDRILQVLGNLLSCAQVHEQRWQRDAEGGT